MRNLMELNFNVEVFIIDGNFECSSIDLIQLRSNQKQWRKMQLYALCQESNLRFCDHISKCYAKNPPSSFAWCIHHTVIFESMIFESSYKRINNLTLTPPQHKYINSVGNFSPGGFFVGVLCCSRRSKFCSQFQPRTRLKRAYINALPKVMGFILALRFPRIG